jgi:hypothetical protein
MGALNRGILPKGYYALSEQRSPTLIPDVLTLNRPDSGPGLSFGTGNGGITLADAPLGVSRKMVADPQAAYRRLRRTLTIRHISGHRIVAFLEIVSPANKDRPATVKDFADKVDAALLNGIHVLVADLFPPGKHDPLGIHGALWTSYSTEEYLVPTGRPLTLASYRVSDCVEAYIDHLAFGDPLPSMPLFLDPDAYIKVPLESTYVAAYEDLPDFTRDVLEKGTSSAT